MQEPRRFIPPRERTGPSRQRTVRLVELPYSQREVLEPGLRLNAAMPGLFSDFRYAVRCLIRQPLFALLAILTFAAGVGANTSVFSVVESVLLRPLPYPNAGRLVALGEPDDQGSRRIRNVGYLTVEDWRARTHEFEAFAAYRVSEMAMSGAGTTPEQLTAVRASAQFFDVLGVAPERGRFWTAQEDRPGNSSVAVLSHDLWQRRFGARSGIIGRDVMLNERAYRVIGIAQPELRTWFAGPSESEPDLYVPLAYDASFRDACRTCRHLRAIGLLRNGSNVERARTELGAAQAEIAREHPQDYRLPADVVVEPLLRAVVSSTRKPLTTLVAATCVVLLIACANIANLLLMRGVRRRREVQVRASLGATPLRIVRWLLAESAVIAVAGGAAGILFAAWLTPLLVKFAPAEIPRLPEQGLNWTVLILAMAATVVAGLLSGALPAVAAARFDISGTFRAAGHSSETERQRGVRHLLVIAEFALVFGLSTGAGLFGKSFVKLLQVSPGFDASGIVTANVNSVSPRYPRPQDDIRFFTDVDQRVRSLPGVEQAALVSVLPMSGNFDMSGLLVEGRHFDSEADIPGADRYVVTPGYFSTMRIVVKRGRAFTDADREGAPLVAMVSESAAKLFPEADPIGRRIRVGPSRNAAWAEVIGVVTNVRQYGLDITPGPQFYLPLAQYATGYMTIVARTKESPETALPAMRHAVEQVDPTRALSKTGTLEHRLSASFAQRRFVLILVGAYAGLALLLAVVGLYGTMAYSIAARMPEIGIRLALGASRARIAALVLRQAMRLTIAGFAAGLLLSYIGGRYAGSLLFGVSPFDAEVIASAGLVMLAAAGVATIVPLRRALRAELTSALKCE